MDAHDILRAAIKKQDNANGEGAKMHMLPEMVFYSLLCTRERDWTDVTHVLLLSAILYVSTNGTFIQRPMRMKIHRSV